jgi:hypothetical protein
VSTCRIRLPFHLALYIPAQSLLWLVKIMGRFADGRRAVEDEDCNAQVSKYGAPKDWRHSKYPVRQILRACAFAYMGGAFVEACLTPGLMDSRHELRAYGFEYLTLLGFMGTQLTLLVSVLNEHFPELRTLKIFMTAVFVVVEGMIASLYWSLYFISKELILHKDTILEKGAPPLFMDTAAHGIPFVYLLCEFFYSRSSVGHVRRQRALHIITIASFSLLYNVWIFYLFRHDNGFPYPFLQEIGGEGRAVFAIIGTSVGVYLYGLMFMGLSRYHQQLESCGNAEEGEDIEHHSPVIRYR